jgi:hypothetical protein
MNMLAGGGAAAEAAEENGVAAGAGKESNVTVTCL